MSDELPPVQFDDAITVPVELEAADFEAIPAETGFPPGSKIIKQHGVMYIMRPSAKLAKRGAIRAIDRTAGKKRSGVRKTGRRKATKKKWTRKKTRKSSWGHSWGGRGYYY